MYYFGPISVKLNSPTIFTDNPNATFGLKPFSAFADEMREWSQVNSTRADPMGS